MNPSPYPAPFTSAHVRASIVKILLIVGAVAAGISLLAEALSSIFPPLTDEQELSNNPTGVALMLIVFLLGLLELIIYLTTVVFFLMWLYRAYDNLRAFHPWRRLDYSPGWAVGSFFIPFVNLVVPYRAVKEVWQKSGPPDEALLSEPGPPAWFPIWWLFWLLSSFAGNISMRASFNENVSESTATIISIVASALYIVAAVLAYLVVDAIDKRQEETSGKVKLGKFSGPPPPPANLPMPDVVTPALGPNNSQQS
jgi:hypothetical protein